jgi:phage shock protein PspC (stress-responsive transcriptional regulator)
MTESDELAKLADLHQRGMLSPEEFARAKTRVLNGVAGAVGTAPAMGALNAWHRSRTDRWLSGVCGGIGPVTGVPSWVWRLLFTFLALFAGTGVLVYILMWIFVPEDPVAVDVTRQTA